MTGRQLKEWASRIPDEARIETSGTRYQADWVTIESDHIRAVMYPTVQVPEMNTVEGIRD